MAGPSVLASDALSLIIVARLSARHQVLRRACHLTKQPRSIACASWRGWSGGLGTRRPKTSPTRSLRPPGAWHRKQGGPATRGSGRPYRYDARSRVTRAYACPVPSPIARHGHFPGADGALKQVGSVVRGPKSIERRATARLDSSSVAGGWSRALG